MFCSIEVDIIHVILVCCMCVISHRYMYIHIHTLILWFITALVVQKCIWEAINTIQYLWIPFIDNNYFYENAGDDNDCKAPRKVAIWAFISQVSRMAGNLQLLILAVDLHRSSSNPFEAYQLREKYYLGFIWFVSLCTGFILLSFGNNVYGLSSNMTCWIQVSEWCEYFRCFGVDVGIASVPLLINLNAY